MLKKMLDQKVNFKKFKKTKRNDGLINYNLEFMLISGIDASLVLTLKREINFQDMDESFRDAESVLSLGPSFEETLRMK